MPLALKDLSELVARLKELHAGRKSLAPLLHYTAKSAAVAAAGLMLFMTLCGAGIFLLGACMIFIPSLRGSWSDFLTGLTGIPLGGWLAVASWRYVRRGTAAILHPVPAIRLDDTGLLVGERSPRLFRWSEGPSFRLVGGVMGYVEARSPAGFSGRVNYSDVPVPLKAFLKQVEAFQKAYRG